jgi:hypothetical protein
MRKYVPHSVFDIPKDAPKWALDWSTKLHNEFKNISNTYGKDESGRVTVIGAMDSSATSSGSGSSTTTTTNSYRTGITSVGAGTTFIPFSTPLSNTYHLILELYNSENILMPQATASITMPQVNAGFTITTEEFLYVKYTAIEIG